MSRYDIVVNADDVDKKLSALPAQLLEGISAEIEASIARMARDAKKDAPKATSLLTNSINTQMVDPLQGLVVVGQDYGAMVESGTSGGKFPPLDHIMDWIRVKHIVPNDPHDSVRDLAWMIAAKIADAGTPAQPYLGPAYDANVDDVTTRIEAAIGAALAAA